MIILKELREKRGMNMKEAAIALGLPYTTYVNYEKGTREPDSEKLIKMSRFYNVTIDQLLGRKNICLQKNIRYLRKNKGMSQEELANAIGCCTSDEVQRWEDGLDMPSLVTLRKLCRVFNVSVDDITVFDLRHFDLIFGDEEENPTGENTDGIPEAKLTLVNAIYEQLKTLPDAELRVIGQVVETIRNRGVAERPHDEETR